MTYGYYVVTSEDSDVVADALDDAARNHRDSGAPSDRLFFGCGVPRRVSFHEFDEVTAKRLRQMQGHERLLFFLAIAERAETDWWESLGSAVFH